MTTSVTTKIAAVLGGLLVAASFVALAVAWTGESTDEAKADFCDSLTELSSTVMSYGGLDPRTATVSELEEAEADVDAAWDEVVDDAYDWVYAYDNPLNEAYDDLYYAIEDLPGDYTVAQSLDALEDELEAIPQAYQETFDGSGCDHS
jgi:hypothetical protein